MIIVGLTGGIGSGKTTVAKMFTKLGIPTYIADFEAKKLMNNSKVIRRKLIKLFGINAYKNEELNKPFIADKIFSRNDLLEKMNAIVHPKVKLHFKKWIEKQDSPYVIYETAILFENGRYQDCDYIITVTVSENERIQRVIKRDNTTVAKVKAIIDNQWNESKKIKLSHFVIDNNNLIQTEKKVKKINQDILKLIQ